jgi:hypothetical protein
MNTTLYFLLGGSFSSGSAPSVLAPDIIVVEPAYPQGAGPIIGLKQDLGGTTESRVLGIDLVNKITVGDTLTGTPTFLQDSETFGSTSLIISSPQIDGTLAIARITGGTLGAFYDVSCTVQTTNGDVLVGSCRVTIVPSR